MSDQMSPTHIWSVILRQFLSNTYKRGVDREWDVYANKNPWVYTVNKRKDLSIKYKQEVKNLENKCKFKHK